MTGILFLVNIINIRKLLFLAGYNWKNQMINEVIVLIQENFNTVKKGFEFFTHNKETQEITPDLFFEAINQLIPNRFTTSDIHYLWTKLANGKQTIGINTFEEIYDTKKHHLKIIKNFQQLKKTSPINNNFFSKALQQLQKSQLIKNKKFAESLTQQTSQEPQIVYKNNNNNSSEDIIEKVKEILRASNGTLQEVYSVYDVNKTGFITNLEFRNGLQKLNLGLTNKEIDKLQHYTDVDKNGFIKWKEFVKLFQLTEVKERILLRAKAKLAQIRNNIYSYMISPKDAFRQFNVEQNDKLTFEEFTKFIEKLCQLSREEIYPYSQVKDLYEFIDIKKDGVLDMNEWLQSFRIIDPDYVNPQSVVQQFKESILKSPLMTRFTSSAKKSRIRQTAQKFRQSRTIFPNASTINFGSNSFANEIYQGPSAINWELNKEYDKIMQIIAKNRKYLIDSFNYYVKKGQKITKYVAIQVISNVLRGLGYTIEDRYWPYVLKFAEREGIIDYKFLLDVYKGKCTKITSHPSNIC